MKRSVPEKIFNVFNIGIMISTSIIFLYPYINQLAISLNEGQDTGYGGITIYPRVFTLDNYMTVFGNDLFFQSFMISILRVIIGTAVGIFITLTAAYALSKKRLPGKNFFITMLIIPMFINGGIIPKFVLYRHLDLINSFWVYIWPSAYAFYNMIIMRTYLSSLPDSLEESAMIDGANPIQILIKIYIPLSMPVIATISLWLAVMHWNDWTTTLLFVTSKKYHTLQYILYRIFKEAELIMQMAVEKAMEGEADSIAGVVTPESVKASTLIVSTLPIVVLYPFLQKYFVKGVMIGAIKE